MLDLWEFFEDQHGDGFKQVERKKSVAWLRRFQREGFTPSHLELGKRKDMELCETFAPNLNTFVSWCRPTYADYGLPDEDDAFNMAVRREWRKHPILWHVVNDIGAIQFHNDWSEKQCRKQFIKAYRKFFSRHVGGQQYVLAIPEVPQLPPPTATKDEIKAARKMVEDMLRPVKEGKMSGCENLKFRDGG